MLRMCRCFFVSTIVVIASIGAALPASAASLGDATIVGVSDKYKSTYRDLSLAFGGRMESVSLDKRHKALVRAESPEVASVEGNPVVGDDKLQDEDAKEEAEKKAKEAIEEKEKATKKAFEEYKCLYTLFAENDESRAKEGIGQFKLTQFPADPWWDLRLVKGDKGTPLVSLISKLSRTKTKMGSVYFEKLLVSPIRDVSTLKKRQNLLKKLIEDDVLYESVKALLENISRAESTLLSMWQLEPNNDEECLFNDRVELYWEVNNRPKKIKWWNLWDQWNYGKWRKYIDNNPTASLIGLGATAFLGYQFWSGEIYRVGGLYEYVFNRRFTNPVKNVFQMLAGIRDNSDKKSFDKSRSDLANSLENVRGNKRISHQQMRSLSDNMGGFRNQLETVPVSPRDGAAMQSIDRIFSRGFVCEAEREKKEYLKDMSNNPFGAKQKYLWQCGNRGLHVFWSVMLPFWFGGWFISNMVRRYKAFKCAYREVKSLASLLQSGRTLMSNFGRIDEKAREALTLLPELGAFAAKGRDKEFNALSRSLKSSVINPGKLMSVYKRIFELRDKFSRSLEAVGQIDAYFSIATLYREHRGNKNHFCFPTYESAAKPHLLMNGVWDSFIESCESVPNSVEFGGKLTRRNAIISGPNAGGKSTFMRAVLAATLLGQACGIMPAQMCALTPFAYLDSYVNVEDDPAAKKSLFRVQAARVSSLIDNVEKLACGHYALIIVDEMFSGTNPRDAACIGRAVANKISALPNSLWLISTHYSEITRIERDSGGIFTNFMVGVNRDKDGNFLGYPFKVVPGITHETTAYDVLKMENFHQDILGDARRMRGW